MVRHACFGNLILSEKKASVRNLILVGDALLAKSATGVTVLIANRVVSALRRARPKLTSFFCFVCTKRVVNINRSCFTVS